MQYAYVDDLAIMHADADWQTVEEVLSKDMATVNEYFQTWKLNFKTTKTAVFHFNKEAKCELKANHNNKTLPFCSEPKYCSSEKRSTGRSRITDISSHFAIS